MGQEGVWERAHSSRLPPSFSIMQNVFKGSAVVFSRNPRNVNSCECVRARVRVHVCEIKEKVSMGNGKEGCTIENKGFWRVKRTQNSGQTYY